jgi:hypothetical protein
MLERLARIAFARHARITGIHGFFARKAWMAGTRLAAPPVNGSR